MVSYNSCPMRTPICQSNVGMRGNLSWLRVAMLAQTFQRNASACTHRVLPVWLMFTAHALASSLDTWTVRNPLPTANALFAITYGNDQFVAVGDLGTIITSPDGVNWTVGQS